MIKGEIFLGKRYEVLSKIGAGGMADVYKGKDHMLNRYVAIKVLKKEYKEDENFVRKFRSEAQAAAGLMNPNIVNVYDVGEDRGLYYMVMELVEGITLKEYIEKKGRLPYTEVISIAIQMCTGIGAAHASHIIHRDIKPHNMIISRDGKVKVTDFGIAKAVTSNTISSNAMGSVHYTSPEQARGGFSDAKSDIYSIGITLYEMVTGQVPFNGDSTVTVALKHLQEEITPPSELVKELPYSLDQIILKCTQKNAERRYGSTSDLIMDLKRSLVDPEGDFVVIPPLGNADTVIITDEELDDIRGSYDEEDFNESDYEEEYDSDEYDDEEYDSEYDDDDEYDDDEYDDDDNFEKGRKGKKNSEEVNPRMNKVMKIMTIVVAVIIVFIAIFAIGKAAGIFKTFGPGLDTEETDSSQVKVPDVVGLTEEQAKESLKKKGLGIKVVVRQESKKYQKGTVSEQKTDAGKKVKKNTTIQVVVSSGLVGEEISVPDVNGMSEEQAQKALENAGLKVGTSEFAFDDNVAEGLVIGTTPGAGSKATKATQIRMKVSKGAEKKVVTVPNIAGASEADARNALQAAGLSAGTVTYEYNDSVAEGAVVSQSQASGKKVAPGTAVDFAVSQGKKPDPKVTVPPVTGTSLSNAKQLISGAGLNVGNIEYKYSDSVETNYVISSNPGDGNSVDTNTAVNLVVSKGKEPTPTPTPTPPDENAQ